MNLDVDLFEKTKVDGKTRFRVWGPKGVSVVLGKSNVVDKEVLVKNCEKDKVGIFRRLGGGGTVLLCKGAAVISIAKKVDNGFDNLRYLRSINDIIIDCLQGIGIKNLCQKGVSDICIGNRKVMGSSMYRSGDYLFYQGSLLVDMDIGKVHVYLRHPSKEPDYRNGRLHAEFLTTLSLEGYSFSVDWIVENLGRSIDDNLRSVN